MNLSFSQNVKCPVDETTLKTILDSLEDEFKKISIQVVATRDNGIQATSINASFGSILRKDTSTITVKNNRNNDGYIINCDTVYKPSVAFWIFTVIDFILITTVIGFLIGFGATLGLYFYNKTLVEKGINSTLDKVKQNIE